MKSLHKRISAVVLAGMIVVGGCLASGVSAHAISIQRVEISASIAKFAKKEGFRILDVQLSEKEIKEAVMRIVVRNNHERERLLKGKVEEYKDRKDFKRINKSKKMHIVKLGSLYYLIRFR